MPLPVKGSPKKAPPRGAGPAAGSRRTDAKPAGSTMGNGASATTHVVVEGEAIDVNKIKELLPQLRQQLKQRDESLERVQKELADQKLVELLKEKDAELQRCKEEIHKLKSVLQATLHKDGKPDILSTIHEEAAMVGQEGRGKVVKKQGVSGESSGSTNAKPPEIKHFPKDFRWVGLSFNCFWGGLIG